MMLKVVDATMVDSLCKTLHQVFHSKAKGVNRSHMSCLHWLIRVNVAEQKCVLVWINLTLLFSYLSFSQVQSTQKINEDSTWNSGTNSELRRI